MTKAAVFTGASDALEIWDIDVAAPKAGEVKVRLAASGVCHTDLSILNGTIHMAPPMVIGHEGAGIVEEIGPGVTLVQPGDHVVISWVPQCGKCYCCDRGQPELCEAGAGTMMSGGMLDGTKRFSRNNTEIGQMAASGTFAEYTVIPEISAVKIDNDLPLDKMCLIGCGVLTGAGAAINTAQVGPGDTVAVIGCGGVGLNTIQGARIAGAERIIAVDMVASKLKLAEQFGATDTVNAANGDPVAAVQSLTGTGPLGPRGVDYAFEVVGSSVTAEQAMSMTRRGGTMTMVGVGRVDDTLKDFSLFGELFMGAKTIKGSVYGSANVHRDVLRFAGLYRQGKLLLDELISKTIKLEEVNQAFADIQNGEVARSVILY